MQKKYLNIWLSLNKILPLPKIQEEGGICPSFFLAYD